MTNRELEASRGSDERLRAPNVNLGKLVPLEVHGRVRNAKIAKKYFPMSKWGVPYTVGKLKKRDF